MKPDYIAQTGECRTPEQRVDWIRARIFEARQRGVIHGRATVDGSQLLYEGWKERPVNEAGQLDEGEPRWQMSASEVQAAAMAIGTNR